MNHPESSNQSQRRKQLEQKIYNMKQMALKIEEKELHLYFMSEYYM